MYPAKTLHLKTTKQFEFIDITNLIQQFIDEQKIESGLVIVFSKHTTFGIRINEQEKGIFADFADLMHKLIPKDAYYRHNDLSIRTENLVCDASASDCLNGHSHCISLLGNTSETVPIVNSKLALGKWQRIFAIEFDCARNREILIQLTF